MVGAGKEKSLLPLQGSQENMLHSRQVSPPFPEVPRTIRERMVEALQTFIPSVIYHRSFLLFHRIPFLQSYTQPITSYLYHKLYTLPHLRNTSIEPCLREHSTFSRRRL